ncbi:MAG: hypothetical protein ACYDCC_07650 [Actinomycetota bacterium]
MTAKSRGHKMRRRFLVVSILSLALIGTSIAYASPVDTPQPGTAYIAKGLNVYSGGQTDIQIGVKAAGLQPVTWIAITPGSPSDLTLLSGATAVSGSGGWTVASFTNNRVIFTGGKATPAADEVFDLPTQVLSTAVDTGVDWKVETSFDNGAHKRQYTPTTAGSLTTEIRVLKLISGPGISAPAAAEKGFVSQGQSLTISTVIQNVGSQALTINTTYTPTGATIAAVPSKTLNPGDTVSLDAAATITGAPKSTAAFHVVIGTAAGDAIVPPQDSTSSTIQNPIALSCEAIAPGESQTGATQTFQVGLEKTGDPTADLPAVTLTVLSDQPFTTGSTALHLDAGDHTIALGNQPSPLNFPPINVTGVDGTYKAQLNLTGADANGNPFPASIPCTGQVRIDNQAPLVILDPPQLPLIPVAGNSTLRQTAAKNGDSIGFSGKITEPNGCTGGSISGFIQQFAADGSTTSLKAFDTSSVIVLATDGITCTFQGSTPALTFDPTATSFVIHIWAFNFAGIKGHGVTVSVPIDNTPLTFTAKTTSPTTLHLDFNECVLGSSLPIDWTGPLGDVFISVGTTPCKTKGSPLTIGGLDLALVPPLPTNNAALPTIGQFPEDATVPITYNQIVPDSLTIAVNLAGIDLSYFNGAGNKLQGMTVNATDGIPPPVPTFDSVDPGTNFQTNGGPDGRPTFHISNVNPGDVVCLFIDGGSGKVDSSATPLLNTCPAVAAGANTITIKTDVPITGVDRTLNILAQVNDGGITSLGSHSLIFRTVGPKLADATIQSGGDNSTIYPLGVVPDATITVDFNEGLVGGANSADDWVLLDNNGNPLTNVSVTGVSTCMGGGPQCVSLSIDAQGTNAWMQIAKLRYAPTSGASAYQDGAGNTANNSQVDVAQGGGAPSGAPSVAPPSGTPSIPPSIVPESNVPSVHATG